MLKATHKDLSEEQLTSAQKFLEKLPPSQASPVKSSLVNASSLKKLDPTKTSSTAKKQAGILTEEERIRMKDNLMQDKLSRAMASKSKKDGASFELPDLDQMLNDSDEMSEDENYPSTGNAFNEDTNSVAMSADEIAQFRLGKGPSRLPWQYRSKFKHTNGPNNDWSKGNRLKSQNRGFNANFQGRQGSRYGQQQSNNTNADTSRYERVQCKKGPNRNRWFFTEPNSLNGNKEFKGWVDGKRSLNEMDWIFCLIGMVENAEQQQTKLHSKIDHMEEEIDESRKLLIASTTSLSNIDTQINTVSQLLTETVDVLKS